MMPLADISVSFLLIALTAFFLGGVFKGALGFGLPLLAIPAMTAADSLTLALSVAIFPVFFTNAWQTWAFRAHWQGWLLRPFLTSAVLGLGIGAMVLTLVPEAFLEVVVGIMVLIFLISERRKSTLDAVDVNPGRGRLAPLFGFLAGTVHGATGLSGLVGTPYFHALRLPRPAFILCNGTMFVLFGVLHGPLLGSLGLYKTSGVTVGLLALPVAFLGIWFGGYLGTRLDAERFSTLVVGLLGVAAIIPIWNGLADLFGF